MTDKRYNDAQEPTRRPVSTFMAGLLPEGNLRQQLSARWGVTTSDIMGLLHHVGAECAGAVQFLPAEQLPSEGRLRLLSETELNDVIAALPTYAIPDGAEPQASLAGLQDKVLLAHTEAGWCWPEDGAASTHLIKPDPGPQSPVRNLIGWEHWSQRVARLAGLDAASTELANFGGRDALIVQRYDRTATGERIHQEDLCQALAMSPEAKYESTAEARALGSRLKRIVAAASPYSTDPGEFREELLRRVTFNVALGNSDAHAKNYSLLIDRTGTLSWAPVYDTSPLAYLNPAFRGSGLIVNGHATLPGISPDDLAAEATSWGVPRRRALELVIATYEATYDAAHSLGTPDEQHVIAGMDKAWTRQLHPVHEPQVPAPALDPGDASTTKVWVKPHVRGGRHIAGYWRDTHRS